MGGIGDSKLERGSRRAAAFPRKTHKTPVSVKRQGGGKKQGDAFPYLQDTVISTLVAGIEALRGSKSPMDAMLTKVLLILSERKI